MSTSAILFTILAVLVVANARFIAPPLIRPLLPVPFIAPFHPPIVTPFIHPIPPPVFPIVRGRTVTRSRRIARPRSKPFVIENRGFLPRQEDPVIIKIVESREPRDVVVIENKQPVLVERPRYYDDANSGDISIDGNVYISDPFAATDLQRGASMDNVLSRAITSGQLATGDNLGSRGDMDYAMSMPNVNVNVQSSPIEPIIDSQAVTIL